MTLLLLIKESNSYQHSKKKTQQKTKTFTEMVNACKTFVYEIALKDSNLENKAIFNPIIIV